MSKKKLAVVIIPTYNERENILRTLDALEAVFKDISSWQMEVLVVDDTSPDKTYEVVKDLTKHKKWVHLLVNKHKSGLGGAYLKGMEHAFGVMQADVAFEFDADMSHNPTKIPEFLRAVDDGADLVLGSRYIKGGGIPSNWGLHRKFLSVVGNIVIMFVMTDFSIRDWTTGYRAIRRKLYEEVRDELSNKRFSGYTFQIGFLFKALRKGFKVTEVPFVFVDREHGHSKLGPEYIKNTLLFILQVRMKEIFSSRLFKFAFVGGTGALVQLSSLRVFYNMLGIYYQLAFFMAIEIAVVSNFILNNLWTFSDRRLSLPQIPGKFLQFNLASAGSIIIQQIIAFVGEYGIGLFTLFTIPLIHFSIGTDTMYAVLGIVIGMFWNFFAYNRFIWKK